MKKLYFFFVALMVCFSASAVDYVVSGNINSWAANNSDYKFTANGDGTYSVTLAKLTSGFKIKSAEDSWNNSYNYGATSSTASVATLTPGTTMNLKNGADSKDILLAETLTNVTLTFNPTALTLVATGTSQENEYTDVYVVGDFGSGWSEDPSKGIKLSAVSDSQFKGDMTLTAGTSYLKFRAGDLVFGTGGGDMAITLGTSMSFTNSGNAFSLGAGEYEVVLNLVKGATSGTFTVTSKSGSGGGDDPEPQTVYALAGAFNGWSATANTTTTVDKNCVTFVVENWSNSAEGQSDGFQIVDNGTWYGYNTTTCANGQWYTFATGYENNATLDASAEGKTVTFTYAIDKHTVMAAWSEGGSGGDDPGTGTEYTVSYNNGKTQWEAVYAYAWNETDTKIIGEWPGTAMVKGADDVWTLTFTTTSVPANIKFSNGAGTETGNFEFENGKEYGEAADAPTVYALVGVFNEWDGNANATTTVVDNCVTFVVDNWTGGGFKVIVDGTWYGKYASEPLANGVWSSELDPNGTNDDLTLVAAAEGKTVTFTYATDTKTIKAEWSTEATPGTGNILAGSEGWKTIGTVDGSEYAPAGTYAVTTDSDNTLTFKVSLENTSVTGLVMNIRLLNEAGGEISLTDLVAGTDGYYYASPAKVYEAGETAYFDVRCAYTDGLSLTNTYTYEVGSSTGIEAVESFENVAPVYYTLQGVRVANPNAGVYIVVRGNKVSKEYIR